MKRRPYRAGSFYDADEASCRRNATDLVNTATLPEEIPESACGGLVPHAGWIFSGKTAALTVKALAERGRLKTVIMFGSDHWGIADGAAVYDQGSWQTPLGQVPVNGELAAALLKHVPTLRADPQAHTREHSIEVQLPLMQALQADVRVVPINVSPSQEAVEAGRQIGELLKRDFPAASVVGSTDLTHYGPSYGFAPGGMGASGLEWAKENDTRLLKLIQTMQADKIIEETASRHNACGGGAIAATMAACAAMGATRGICLEYTTSAEVMARMHSGGAEDCVGYAAVIFA